jgi:hypothetical protein
VTRKKKPRGFKQLPGSVFYDVLGLRADRWADACDEYLGGKITHDDLSGWFAAVIMTAYGQGHADGIARKRSKF